MQMHRFGAKLKVDIGLILWSSCHFLLFAGFGSFLAQLAHIAIATDSKPKPSLKIRNLKNHPQTNSTRSTKTPENHREMLYMLFPHPKQKTLFFFSKEKTNPKPFF